jgi:hypothetical protein
MLTFCYKLKKKQKLCLNNLLNEKNFKKQNLIKKKNTYLIKKSRILRGFIIKI